MSTNTLQAFQDAVLSRLQSTPGFKQEGDHYRMNSPLRPGSDSLGFVVTLENEGSGGQWIDHANSTSGSLYDLGVQLGIEPPRRAVETSKRSYTSLADYAALKGVTEADFVAAGWQPDVKTVVGRPALEFKVGDFKRWRFLDGKKPTFYNQPGFVKSWYGLNTALKTVQDGQPLIICNGEPSVVVALKHGIPAFALSGGEGHTIPPQLVNELRSKWDGEILIALDNDAAGKGGSQKIAQILSSAGIKNRPIDLLLSTGGDLADFCKLYTHEARARLLDMPPLVLNSTPAQVTTPETQADLTALLKELTAIRKGEQRQTDMPIQELVAKIRAETDYLMLKTMSDADKPFAAVMADYETWLDENYADPPDFVGLRTGITKLDGLIGGLELGTQTTLLAETGMGKTTLTASIASALLDQAPGIIIPTEIRARAWTNKLMAARTQIRSDLIAKGQLTVNQYALVKNTIALINSRQCRILETRSPSPDQILTAVRAGIARDGFKWAIIDSISNVSPEENMSIFDRTSAAADCAQELARLGLAVLCTSQVGRSLSGRASKVPTLHDGKGSGRIEENSDLVMAIYNHEAYVKRGEAEAMPEYPDGTILIRCLKHRNSGDAENKSIHAAFVGGWGYLTNDIPD